jgi:hypothetical protein
MKPTVTILLDDYNHLLEIEKLLISKKSYTYNGLGIYCEDITGNIIDSQSKEIEKLKDEIKDKNIQILQLNSRIDYLKTKDKEPKESTRSWLNYFPNRTL